MWESAHGTWELCKESAANIQRSYCVAHGVVMTFIFSSLIPFCVSNSFFSSTIANKAHSLTKNQMLILIIWLVMSDDHQDASSL